ncbi:MAG: TlpA disulfide reductase family protein [Chloroflexota bacterium]
MPIGIPFFACMTFSPLQRIGLYSLGFCLLILAGGIVMYTGLPNRADYDLVTIDGVPHPAPALNSPAPPISTSTLSGDAISLADVQGQWVIVNFWATWCVPCRVEMPELQALHEERADVAVIGINIGESRPVMTAWIEELDLTFDIVPDPQGDLYNRYRVRGQPSTYVINPDGIITRIIFGATSLETLLSAIDSTQP